MSKSNFLKVLLAFAFLSLLSGCLTSLRPFYLPEQVAEDSRLLGVFKHEKAGHVWKVERNEEQRKGYLATLGQDGAWSKYQLTLFKFKERTYLDIFPESDSSLVRSPGGPPSMSQIMRGLTSQPLHLLVEVELTETQLTIRAISRLGLEELRKIRPNLRLLGEQGVIPAPYSANELQSLLGEISGNERVFDYKAVLKKDPSSMSRPIESTCPACRHSYTVMSADAEDLDECWRVRCLACGYQYNQQKQLPNAESGSAGGVKLLQGSTIIRTSPGPK
jgi:hypothetical protein